MRFLLDTNICIYILKRKPISVLQRFQKIDAADIGLSIVTLAELEYGAAKSQNPERNRAALETFLQPFEIVGLTANDARQFGEIRADLERRGELIGGYDMLIAAQALNRGLIVVTNNVREFRRIRGLAVENWVD
ncbi:MAG TPA: type II toxin-antitoxin system VapC family toxin [Oscillatoriaceae cyanobacterium M33_DOE_052]|uniref:Ribonuclease VapC n=1 Tax=Planktothricoides sp. SpSt-374 TaxID=2282167 RepID=A0A7C3VG53_9CYAN|nr:type II toxin-antitoxin system VapC family toxin [Oscillatoriaceae cyanobacterium M33_DOE_052]